MEHSHDDYSRKMLLMFVLISGKYDLPIIYFSEMCLIQCVSFKRYYTVNYRNEFLINLFSNGTNSLVMNLDREIFT